MRWLLALWLAIAPACAQEAVIGSGVYASKSTAAAYTGPGDVVSGAGIWYGLRAYSSSIASGGTQKLVNLRNTGTNEQCDVVVATNGGLASTVSSCTGSSSGNTVSTFCSGGCAVTKLYDQSGNAINISQSTAASQPTFTASCINSLPCLTFSGANSFLTVSGQSSHSTPNSVSAVGLRTASGSQQTLFSGSAASEEILYWPSTANAPSIFSGSTVSGSGTDNVTHAENAVFGASGVINVDGAEASGSSGTQVWDTVYFIGRDTNGDQLTGKGQEFGAWFGTTFTSGNRTSLCRNQQAYYGSGNFGAVC